MFTFQTILIIGITALGCFLLSGFLLSKSKTPNGENSLKDNFYVLILVASLFVILGSFVVGWNILDPGWDPDEAPLTVEDMQGKADSFLLLFDNMPRIPIRISEKPIHDPSTPKDSVAFFALKGYRDTDTATIITQPTIFVKQEYLNGKFISHYIDKTLKHELTHAWINWKNINDGDHGPIFQRKLEEVLSK